MLVLCAALPLSTNALAQREYSSSSSEIDQAISVGESWLANQYYDLGDGSAVMRMTLGIPLKIYCHNKNQTMLAGDLLRPVYVDYGETTKYGSWSKVETIEWNEYQYKFERDPVCIQIGERYYWSMSFDDLWIKAKEQVDASNSKRINYTLTVNKIQNDIYDIYLGSHLLLANVSQNGTSGSYTYPHDYEGFPTFRYVFTHDTILAERYYESIGDTTKSQKLWNMLTSSDVNVTTDADDCFYNKSTSYPDDYPWDADYAFPQFTYAYGSMPYLPSITYPLYPYRSHFYDAVGTWCSDVAPWAPESRTRLASHLGYKHPDNPDDGWQESARQLDRECEYENFGMGKHLWCFLLGVYVTAYTFPVYSTWRVANYLSAMCQLANESDMDIYKTIADQLCAVLLNIQWKGSGYIQGHGSEYLPQWYGSFPTGYDYNFTEQRWEFGAVRGGSFDNPLIDWLYNEVAGFDKKDQPDEYIGYRISDVETTIRCLHALRLYKSLLNRTPKLLLNDLTFTDHTGLGDARAYYSGRVEAIAPHDPDAPWPNPYPWATAFGSYYYRPKENITNPQFDCAWYYYGKIGWAGYFDYKSQVYSVIKVWRENYDEGSECFEYYWMDFIGSTEIQQLWQWVYHNYTWTNHMLEAGVDYIIEYGIDIGHGANSIDLWMDTEGNYHPEFCTIVPLNFREWNYKVSETRYMRSDSQTVNGLTAYKLGTTQTTSAVNKGQTTLGLYTVYWASDVLVRDSSGAETVIGDKIAQVCRSTNTYGIQSASWNCSERNLEDTDAIVIKVYTRFGTSGSWILKATFITEQLDASNLDSATWAFYYYTKRFTFNDGEDDYTASYFSFGTSTYNSCIEGFGWIQAYP